MIITQNRVILVSQGRPFGECQSSLGTLMSVLKRLVFCILAFLIPMHANADLSSGSQDDATFGSIFYVVIGGTITSQDRDALLATQEEASAAGLRMAILGSEGGDLAAALEMGRYLRAMSFDAVILPDAVCYSACVFLLAAGVDKKVQGNVGIHRPYFSSGGIGSVSDAIKKTKSEAEAYFEEMNIPGRLAEDMFSIDPANMRILSETELRDYRLNSKDYAAQESDTVGMIDGLGVSREAYEAFRQDLNYSCQIFMGRTDRLNACMRDVANRHGIPLPPELAQ